MLSEALQRNATHEVRLSNISDRFSWPKFGPKIDPRLKASPRGLRPLSCSFASLRMPIHFTLQRFDALTF